MSADALITIRTSDLSIAERGGPFEAARRRMRFFSAAKGISDIIVGQGVINLDFADVRTIMAETGLALMGTGISSGENRSIEAAQKAISSPLLEDISIEGARGLLINITGGPNLTLNEINEATTLIQKEAHDEANIIWGMVIDQEIREEVRVTVIATGFGKAEEKIVPNQVPKFRKVAPMSFSVKENNKEIPAFLRKVKVSERFEEVKLEDPPFPLDDEDRFDIPTFLRKQAD
jgi:cell division protein FtsZ